MLYHRNKAKQLDPALFRKPTSEYREHLLGMEHQTGSADAAGAD